MDYYAKHPDEMIVMYDQVQKNLKMKSDSLQKAEQKVHVLPRK